MIDGIEPREIIAPKDADELARILKKFSDEKCAIVPLGGGTMMGLGAPLVRADVALSLDKFSRILDYQPENLTVRVQAGTNWDALSAALAKHGQMVPLDAPLPARATVGGILAANASGALRVRYGSARDLVIGLNVALADGKLVRGGGQVVKNVAGYDLPKLFIGSLGTLGIITEATFKVVPLPKQGATFAGQFDNLIHACGVALRVLQSKLLPMGVEVLNGAASAQLGLGNAYTLLVRFGGNPRELARQLGDMKSWTGEPNSVIPDDTALWSRLRDFIFERDTVIKVSVLPTRVAETVNRLEQLAGKYQVGCSLQAHAFGIIYAAFSGDTAIAPLIDEMRMSASVTIQCGSRGLRERVNPSGPMGNDLGLMLKLKGEFDPNNVLNPGRFVGGI